jgi:hypothetical protein
MSNGNTLFQSVIIIMGLMHSQRVIKPLRLTSKHLSSLYPFQVFVIFVVHKKRKLETNGKKDQNRF